MHYFHQYKSDLNTTQITDLSARFEHLHTVSELCRLLGVTEQVLQKQIAKPEYHSFHIPKPGGQKRLIQEPAAEIKAIQQSLNRYLQSVYYTIKPMSAHGFIICPNDDPRPRNIYTNALQHCKNEWFLNIDLKDFFHTISLTHLKNLFRSTFFFDTALTKTITHLTTWQGRLPMGAPSSPVLSNLVCIYLDFQMEKLAEGAGATYTRYADDITFSFPDHPPSCFLEQVRRIILYHSFTVNEQKVRLQNRMELPEVTGLVIGKGPLPTLSPAWLKRLKQEIKVLRWFMSEAVRERGLFHAYAFDRFRQSVQGQVAFVGFVQGKDSREYRKLMVKVGQ
jgi:RNA-directed DNA polymerase